MSSHGHWASLGSSSWPGSCSSEGVSRYGFITDEDDMNASKVIGIVLIVAGALGLAYGSFSFTKDTHTTHIGPLQLSVKEKETVNVPVWAGIGAIVAGGLVLLGGSRKG
jgi:hypothetical protein